MWAFCLYVYIFFIIKFPCAGGPLLLMELAFILRNVGSQVAWITNQKSEDANEVAYSLEHKMLNRGVQVACC